MGGVKVGKTMGATDFEAFALEIFLWGDPSEVLLALREGVIFLLREGEGVSGGGESVAERESTESMSDINRIEKKIEWAL